MFNSSVLLIKREIGLIELLCLLERLLTEVSAE
jgi:hypothetical protein